MNIIYIPLYSTSATSDTLSVKLKDQRQGLRLRLLLVPLLSSSSRIKLAAKMAALEYIECIYMYSYCYNVSSDV